MTKILIYISMFFFLNSCAVASNTNETQTNLKDILNETKKNNQHIWGKEVVNKIRRNWLPPYKDRKKAKVKIMILKNGQISKIKDISCAGSKPICNSVQEALQRSTPLPIPPSNLSNNERTLVISFD